MTVGIDVGGTFTDMVALEAGRVIVTKTASTPNQADGMEIALRRTLTDATPLLVHGTTVATNALLERAGVEVVLLTDEGFEDLIEIGRQGRPSLYDGDVDRAAPVVTRQNRTASVAEAAASSADSAVVGLIGGYSDSRREAELAAQLKAIRPDLAVTVAGADFPEFREFERLNTAAVNAYLQPRVSAYLERLEERIVPELAQRLLVMRSSGGLVPPGEAARLPVSILLSGPAGGVLASAELGQMLGHGSVIAFDMGGTSTDVCRVELDRPEVLFQREIDGQVVRMPSVAVHTVGAGGGSIGWRDSGGSLRVGPRSAGAWPGPAAYARGGIEPTVTDADLVVGRIVGSQPLADGLVLNRTGSEMALSELAATMGLSVIEVAAGMIEVVESTMERAVRRVSVEEGADPRGSVLVGFGGAGGLHATAVARRLEMAGVVIPPLAGVFSALGLLVAPPRIDLARSVLLSRHQAPQLASAIDILRKQARSRFKADLGGQSRLETLVECRYLGQAHETPVVVTNESWDELARRFHAEHHRRNGFSLPEDEIEAVTVRVAATGPPPIRMVDVLEHIPTGEPGLGTTEVLVGNAVQEAGVWWRPGMAVGTEVVGPAVVRDGEATIWVGPGERGVLHPSGALEITW